MYRRRFIKITSGSIALLCASPVIGNNVHTGKLNKTKMIIDADTANEIDDLYAITRALLEPNFDILALSSAQWRHRLSPENTMIESQKLNEDILRLMNRQEIPSPMGSAIPVGMPWGGTEPRESPATEVIIREARKITGNEKLVIMSLGAVTNIASAITLAPDIVPNIACYFLSSKFYADKNIWDKDEFNARRDLNALNIMFNTEGLEIHIMPVNILYDFKFSQSEILERLENQPDIWDYLAKRWLSNCPQDKYRIFWDLAAVIALAHPELAEESEFHTPPENVQRRVNVYTRIDTEGMIRDWWRVVDQTMGK